MVCDVGSNPVIATFVLLSTPNRSISQHGLVHWYDAGLEWWEDGCSDKGIIVRGSIIIIETSVISAYTMIATHKWVTDYGVHLSNRDVLGRGA